jgi:hypothetical protein
MTEGDLLKGISLKVVDDGFLVPTFTPSPLTGEGNALQRPSANYLPPDWQIIYSQRHVKWRVKADRVTPASQRRFPTSATLANVGLVNLAMLIRRLRLKGQRSRFRPHRRSYASSGSNSGSGGLKQEGQLDKLVEAKGREGRWQK